LLLKKNVTYLIAGRFFIGIGIFLSISIVNLLYPIVFRFKSLYIITFLILLSSIIYFFLNSKELIAQEILIKIQLFVDIIIINALIYVSGVSESPFIFLLALPIIIASLFLDKKSTILIGVLSFLLLTIVILFYYFFILRFGLFEYLNRLILYAVSFTGIAILSTYLSESLKKYSEEIEKKKEEFKRLNRLIQNMIENIDYGFITINKNGNVIFKNKKTEEMLGDSIKEFLSLFDFYKINKNFVKEVSFNKRIFKVNIEKFSFDDGEHFIIVIEDLTKEKEKEHKQRTEERLLYLGEIAAGMAHEIRNPLASLMASIQLLREGEEQDKYQTNLREIILDDFKRLSSILEDFLIFTENKDVKIIDFDINKEINNLIQELKFKYNDIEKMEVIFFGETTVFRGNPYHFSLILKNLLTNSMKAVNNNVYDINVEILLNKDELVLKIKDKGTGMEEEQLEKIFNPFYTKFKNGMGIGLTIVKRVVELYNGTIQVHSQKNKGTEYTIKIPNKRD
jgi:two-component system sensor histidine kinase PilS (NtrC family)